MNTNNNGQHFSWIFGVFARFMWPLLLRGRLVRISAENRYERSSVNITKHDENYRHGVWVLRIYFV